MNNETERERSHPLKGVKHGPMSEEHKRKISEARKGQKKSPEHIAKIAAALRGKKRGIRPPEVGAKIAATLKGKSRGPMSQMQKDRIREGHAKFRGVPLSEEHKAKIRTTKQAKPFIYDEEWRAKIGVAVKAAYARMTPEERRKLFANFIKAGREAAKEHISDTKPERVVEEVLKLLGNPYEKQKRIGLCTVDFFLPESNVVIEVMGCYWHACEQCGYDGENHKKQRERDRRRRAFLESQGYTVEYVWEHELRAYVDRMLSH